MAVQPKDHAQALGAACIRSGSRNVIEAPKPAGVTLERLKDLAETMKFRSAPSSDAILFPLAEQPSTRIVVPPLSVEVLRTWRERLFTWPWRPWRRTHRVTNPLYPVGDEFFVLGAPGDERTLVINHEQKQRLRAHERRISRRRS